MKIIIPLTKSPHDRGRIGKREKQDWYRALVLALDIMYREGGEARILIASNVQVAGQMHELDIYLHALEELGVERERILVSRNAYETIEQLEIAERIGGEYLCKLVIVSTFMHYLRVRWLCYGKGYEHHIAFGIPRIRELLTDVVLTITFPFIDMLGLRDWFKCRVTLRRMSGKH